MDYEKKYKEALERAKDFMNGEIPYALKRGENVMCWIFPELAKLEDEKIRKALIELVKCNERGGYKLLNNVHTSSMLAWLEKQGSQILANSAKTCKDEQKLTAWSKEDKGKLNWVINVWNRLRRGGDAQTTPSQMEMLEDWLKSIKDKVQPQSKQEWSEEDEENMNNALYILNQLKDTSSYEEDDIAEKIIVWLKSLKQRIGG